MKKYLILLSFFLSLDVFSNETYVGNVLKIRGRAFRNYIKTNREKTKTKKKQKIELKDKIFAQDVITVSKNSLIKIKFLDNTLISIGGNSKFNVKKFIYNKKSRVIDLELIHGKIRAQIRKKAKAGEIIKINSKTASIGVRGTSFLTSVYSVKAKSTTDILLLTGKVKSKVVGMSTSRILSPGESLNSYKVLSDGNYNSISKLSKSSLNYLKNSSDSFLPNLIDKNGELVDLEEQIKSRMKKKAKKEIEKVTQSISDDEEDVEEEEEELVFDVSVEVEEDSSENND